MATLRSLSALTLLSCALSLSACNNSHTADEDTSIVFDLDGAMFDSGVDAPIPETVIGDACTTDPECGETGQCLSIPGLVPGGYCSQACAADVPCPDGSSCLTIGMGQSFCFLDCDPEATTRSCTRAGYGCASNFMVFPSPVCVSGCSDDTDCDTGLSCEVGGGFYGSGTCFDPGSMVGDPCTSDTECPEGGACVTEGGSGWPSGTCVTGCDFATNGGCESGSCIASGFGGGGLCAPRCTTDGDCRDGYACEPVPGAPDRMYCAPACAGNSECTDAGNVCNVGLGTCDVPFVPSTLGATCNRRTGGCEGGTCLTEGTSGFPGAYCAYAGCTLGGTDCPGDGACVEGTTTNLCLDGCATDGDCRTGYACRPSDFTEPTSATVCVPACTATSQCANAARGLTCNVGTGRCTEPFEAARQGEPCASADECPGGRCHTEATDGWSAGTCAAIGCRLSGTGGGVDCGAGSTCVDDGTGDPEIGECLPTCTAGAAGDCRPGYACAVEGTATVGVCRPDCTDTSCDPSRTCEAVSGLCR